MCVVVLDFGLDRIDWVGTMSSMNLPQSKTVSWINWVGSVNSLGQNGNLNCHASL